MTIRDLEKAVAKLPAKKLSAFRSWFYKFEARVWDQQFEQDAQAGRLEAIAEKAIKDFKNGHCQGL